MSLYVSQWSTHHSWRSFNPNTGIKVAKVSAQKIPSCIVGVWWVKIWSIFHLFHFCHRWLLSDLPSLNLLSAGVMRGSLIDRFTDDFTAYKRHTRPPVSLKWQSLLDGRRNVFKSKEKKVQLSWFKPLRATMTWMSETQHLITCTDVWSAFSFWIGAIIHSFK